MNPQPLDALFISYFEEIDRYHNDHLPSAKISSETTGPLFQRIEEGDMSMPARHARQSVGIDGHLYDLRRFFSWTKYGTTAEYRRYCAFAPNHLSGSYYRSLLGGHGYSVHHVNCADRVVLQKLSTELAPRFVLLSSTFLNETTAVMEAVQSCRRSFPDAFLIVGGLVLVEYERSMPASQFSRLLAAWNADAYIVSPEGEEPLLDIMKAGGESLDELDLPHTYLRKGRRFEKSSERAENSLKLDDTWLRWEGLEPASLYHTVHTRTARSCAFKCSFCSYFSTQGPLVLADPSSLEKELTELSKVEGVRSLIFTDDTFNVPPKRFDEILKVLTKFDFEWYSFFRAQYADEDLAKRIKASGCRGLFLGIESIDDVVLKNMNKSATYDAYCRGVSALKNEGIWLHANFIIGYPGDTAANVQKTIEFLDRFDIEFFTVSPFYCSPGTPVWEKREELGIEGQYTSWKHATMDFEEADRFSREMIEAPRHSVFMSELSANCFWHELLFYSNGYSPDELKPMVAAFNGLMGKDHTGDEIRAMPAWQELKRLLDAREMPLPPDVAHREALSTQEAGEARS